MEFIRHLKHQPRKTAVTNAEFSNENGFILLCPKVSLYKNYTSWRSYSIFWSLWLHWSCDKAYTWITVSITTLELSQGWSLGSAGGWVSSKKGSKTRLWKSLIHKLWRNSLSDSISDGELFHWNIFSQTTRQDIFFLHTNISKYEKQTTGNSVLPWRLSEERWFQMMDFHHFSDL